MYNSERDKQSKHRQKICKIMTGCKMKRIKERKTSLRKKNHIKDDVVYQIKSRRTSITNNGHEKKKKKRGKNKELLNGRQNEQNKKTGNGILTSAYLVFAKFVLISRQIRMSGKQDVGKRSESSGKKQKRGERKINDLFN